ncbi:hypothetical protein ILYODFUR_028143 [Ilyodon furcidens]|uniref:Uncharacterized protein n=1 Tax=Ilyodon furcidens TaxID=33524 RepID=A0ABV0U946_9TELE
MYHYFREKCANLYHKFRFTKSEVFFFFLSCEFSGSHRHLQERLVCIQTAEPFCGKTFKAHGTLLHAVCPSVFAPTPLVMQQHCRNRKKGTSEIFKTHWNTWQWNYWPKLLAKTDLKEIFSRCTVPEKSADIY